MERWMMRWLFGAMWRVLETAVGVMGFAREWYVPLGCFGNCYLVYFTGCRVDDHSGFTAGM
jgi:hypothetical protein